mmetsp:Transcript_14988/g.30087  ORF Transcript_14988/g.30087 Transcript_14988/m.30087 type:complete len:207 (-) Transcript_14988:216-836(-)
MRDVEPESGWSALNGRRQAAVREPMELACCWDGRCRFEHERPAQNLEQGHQRRVVHAWVCCNAVAGRPAVRCRSPPRRSRQRGSKLQSVDVECRRSDFAGRRAAVVLGRRRVCARSERGRGRKHLPSASPVDLSRPSRMTGALPPERVHCALNTSRSTVARLCVSASHPPPKSFPCKALGSGMGSVMAVAGVDPAATVAAPAAASK